MDNTVPEPPSLATLSPSLLKTYKSLHRGGQYLFRRLFIALWRYFWHVQDLHPVAYAYALRQVLNTLKPHLTIGEWSILARLYLLSGAGSSTVDSRRISMRSWESISITKLTGKKLLMRTRFDPAHPRLSSHRSTQKVFITFTPAGISFYRGVLKALNDYVMNDVMSYQPIMNRKGQP